MPYFIHNSVKKNIYFASAQALSILFLLLFVTSLYAETMVINITEGIEEVAFEIGDVDKKITSSFVESINVTKLSNTPFELSHIIENASGIQMRRNGGIGNFTSISIRGKSADQVTVYVDGMPINNASGGSVDLSQIPTNQILNIEIYKDHFPAEFSEGSNGGVINIITRRGAKRNQSSITVSKGSFQTSQYDFTASLNHKKWQWMTTAGYLESKNNFRFNFENNTFLNPNDDEIQQRNNNELYQRNFFSKLTYSLNSTTKVFTQTELFNKKKNIPSIYNKPNINASLNNKNKNISFGYSNTAFGSSRLSTQLITKFIQKSTSFIDKKGEITLSAISNRQTHNNVESKIYFKYKQNTYQLTTSNTFRYEALNITDQLNNKNTRLNVRKIFTSSLGADFYFSHKKIIVSPVIRGLLSQDQYNGETETTTGFKKDATFSKTYKVFSPQLGMRYNITDDFTVKTNLSKYYRLPNYTELFGSRGYIGSNDELKPEKGINVDAGFNYSKFISANQLTKFSWDMSLYYSQITDGIVYTFSARGIGKPSNINQSTITGLENILVFEFDYDTLLTSNTTFQMPMNTSNPDKPKLLAGHSFWFQKTRLQTSIEKFNCYFEHVAKSFYYLDNNEDIPTKTSSIFNFGFNIKLKTGDVSLAINNILGQQNKDYFFQPMSGQYIALTTKINLI